MQDRGPGEGQESRAGGASPEVSEKKDVSLGNGNVPAPAWSDAVLPTSDGAREEHRVPAEQVTVRADPALLPET